MMPAARTGVALAAPGCRYAPRPALVMPWLVCAAGATAQIVLMYPGQYPFDSAYQLWQARSGVFGNSTPVATIALWSLLLDLGGGTAALFCVNIVLLWTGLALCAQAVSARLAIRIGWLLAIGLSPLALAEMAHVLSDSHLAAVLMLATGFSAWGLTQSRRAPLAIALALLAYAGCIRHNAIVAIVPFGAIIVPALVPAGAPRGVTRSAGAAALLLASVILGWELDRSLVRAPVTVWPTLALWDLAAISVERRTLLLPPFTHGRNLTVDELVSTGAFDPTANTFLFRQTRSGIRDAVTEPYSGAEARALAAAWLEAMWRYPGAYLRHRLRTYCLLIGPHRGPVQGIAYFELRLPFKDNPPLPTPIMPRAQAAFYRFAAHVKSSWLFAALPYLAALAIAGTIGWRRRDRVAGRLALAVSASALLYAAGLLPLAPAADLRYLTWPITVAPLALAFALVRRSPAPRHRPAEGSS